MVKYTGRGLVVKRPGVLSKVQMLNLVFGGGGLFPSSADFPVEGIQKPGVEATPLLQQSRSGILRLVISSVKQTHSGHLCASQVREELKPPDSNGARFFEDHPPTPNKNGSYGIKVGVRMP